MNSQIETILAFVILVAFVGLLVAMGKGFINHLKKHNNNKFVKELTELTEHVNTIVEEESSAVIRSYSNESIKLSQLDDITLDILFRVTRRLSTDEYEKVKYLDANGRILENASRDVILYEIVRDNVKKLVQ